MFIFSHLPPALHKRRYRCSYRCFGANAEQCGWFVFCFFSVYLGSLPCLWNINSLSIIFVEVKMPRIFQTLCVDGWAVVDVRHCVKVEPVLVAYSRAAPWGPEERAPCWQGVERLMYQNACEPSLHAWLVPQKTSVVTFYRALLCQFVVFPCTTFYDPLAD